MHSQRGPLGGEVAVNCCCVERSERRDERVLCSSLKVCAKWVCGSAEMSIGNGRVTYERTHAERRHDGDNRSRCEDSWREYDYPFICLSFWVAFLDCSEWEGGTKAEVEVGKNFYLFLFRVVFVLFSMP